MTIGRKVREREKRRNKGKQINARKGDSKGKRRKIQVKGSEKMRDKQVRSRESN